MKHIEQITSEQTISETDRLISDDMITTVLNKSYVQATGIEVQPSAPVTSEIEEMPSLITYLLRKIFGTRFSIFRAPLMNEFRDIYHWLRGRLKGSDDGTIPAASLDPSKPLSEHLRLLDDRKITNGDSIDVPDGIALARLICDRTFVGETISTNGYIIGELTEINDDSTWDVCVRRITFHDVKKVRLGCKTIRTSEGDILKHGFFNPTYKALEEIELPNLELLENKQYTNTLSYSALAVGVKIKKLHLPKFRGFTNFGMYYLGIAASCPLLEEIDLPSYVGGNMNPGSESWSGFRNNPELRIIKLNGLTNGDLKNCFNNSPKLIHFEIRDGFNASLNISAAYGTGWSPTMALRTDTDAEDYVDLREDTTMANNLEQFLWNFQHYIADRVADRTGKSALTITLSSAVYAALEAQEGQTILATLTSKNWTVASA